MKRRTIVLASLATVIATNACSACAAGRQGEIEYIPPETERYENCMEIEGQWGANPATGPDGEYGIGDPFVMRYNGKYYLYPSTSDPCDGIKVFESDDMIHWTYRGFAVAESEITSHGAYAPEVVYYNGYFYMCQSRGGQGHYIYRSESPTEGFTLFSRSEEGDEGDIGFGNLGMGIDGSFFVDDDGKIYLMHTSTPAGLKINEITDVDDIRPSTIGETQDLGNANLRHWIEGPGIFRRGDYRYLTYTGNHVISEGYRVAYSYAPDGSGFSDFIQPLDNVTLIDTSPEHYGLGHSSNFNGPDLDSVYTAYHSLVGSGPARRYNLDRYFASGSILAANGVTHRPVAVPSRPTAEAEDASDDHAIAVERIEDEWYVALDHPMQKDHYISFIAYVTMDGVMLKKLYPEQEAAARFRMGASGIIYAYCNRHGLMRVRTPKRERPVRGSIPGERAQ